MLNYDRRKRITVDDAIKHPFFEIGTIRDVMALIGSTNLD
jgi:calcium/calmodulin-dependent protein kinase (CaM kinase) II/calcium-dependent protein kinase